MNLYPYQTALVDEAREAYRDGKRSVLLVAPTGSGKGTMGAAIAKMSIDRGKRVLWIAHRRELILDTASRIPIPTRVLLGDESEGAASVATVASIQTLSVRDDWPEADLVVWDEAHHCAARTYREVSERYPRAHHLGLTATPERADGKPLGGAFEALVSGPQIPDLIADDRLVPVETWAPPTDMEGRLAMTPADAVARYAPDGGAIIYAKNRRHARKIADETPGCHYVDGDTPKDERDWILAAFENGTIPTIANVNILTEGWDCPSARVCIIARGVSHPSTYLQMVGRVLRTHPGKTHATLVDLGGVVHRHGLPDEYRVWNLRGKGIRLRGVKALPPVRQCPACGAAFRSAAVCPRCGYQFAPPELPKVSKAELHRVDVAKAWENVTVPQGSSRAHTFYRDMLMVAKRKGYKPGWAKGMLYREFGRWCP